MNTMIFIPTVMLFKANCSERATNTLVMCHELHTSQNMKNDVNTNFIFGII